MVRTPRVRDVPDTGSTRRRVLVGTKRQSRDVGRHLGSANGSTQWHNGPASPAGDQTKSVRVNRPNATAPCTTTSVGTGDPQEQPGNDDNTLLDLTFRVRPNMWLRSVRPNSARWVASRLRSIPGEVVRPVATTRDPT
jgi:hypothetical protein